MIDAQCGVAALGIDSKRLFVAVELADAILAEAARVIETLRRRAATLAPQARVLWATPERMHVTVRFIGYVDADRAAAIARVLGERVSMDPFDLSIAGTGAFPPSGRPRVIWAGVHDDPRASLAGVEREVTARLMPLGVPEEDRPYRPHLTLGRVKEPGGLRTAALLDRLADHRFGVARVDAITLFESRLSPKGPTYVPVFRTPLR